MTLLEIIRKKRVATATLATPATDRPVLVPSVATVASVAVAKQETSKVVLLEETQRERRREKVLALLAEKPGIQRAFLTDAEADPDGVILAIAIRGVASFEMLIPREKYDAFLLLELIQRSAIQ